MTTLKRLTWLLLVFVSAAGVHRRAPNVLVVSSSKHNHTFQLGAAIAEGAAAAGASTRVVRVADANFTRDVLGWCDAVPGARTPGTVPRPAACAPAPARGGAGSAGRLSAPPPPPPPASAPNPGTTRTPPA